MKNQIAIVPVHAAALISGPGAAARLRAADAIDGTTGFGDAPRPLGPRLLWLT